MDILTYFYECKNEECDRKLRWRVPVENPRENYQVCIFNKKIFIYH